MSLGCGIVKEFWMVECRRERPYNIDDDGKVINEWEVLAGPFESVDKQSEYEIKWAYIIETNNPILEHRYVKYVRSDE